ncbi:MAG: HlyD family efflux transporter periplasmic adaptor subunit, partial [Chitinophagaceae bacterium]|nr:HlyD family efflux transporter periplasmic adaptor subunit [Chitinophagaceae bacterium]
DSRNELSKLLGKQLTIPQINANLLSNETQHLEKRKEIDELEHSIIMQRALFLHQLETFQSQIAEWKKRYLIVAPISGQISFVLPVQTNSYFIGGKLLGYINPLSGEYYAETYLPQRNFGKVRVGQRAQIRLDAYPYAEYGYVNGSLDYIASFATDSGFLARIKLPAGLVTSQQRQLHFRNGLFAESRIITKDLRLVDRFYRSLIESTSR